MIALTIVATLKSVGIILSISLLIAPAQLPFADATLCARAGISGESVSYYRFAGVYLSFYLDSAPAPTIVVLFAIVFIAVFIYATWRDRRNEIVPEAQG